MKTAIIVPLFNPAGYESHVKKFDRFANSMHYPFFTVEASFDGNFMSGDHQGGSLQVYANDNNIMWQKEALINKAVEELPPEYDSVCYMDSDIEFMHPGWLEKAQHELKTHAVVQPFDNLTYLDHNDKPFRMIGSYARNMHAYRRGAGGACGGVILARREIFPLIDYCIVGGGDSTMMFSWTGKYLNHARSRIGSEMRRQFMRDYERLREQTPNGVGFVEASCRHIWHGNKGDRKYFERWKILGDHKFKLSDIEKEYNGLWKWVDNKPLQEAVKEYFLGRNEDAVSTLPRKQ